MTGMPARGERLDDPESWGAVASPRLLTAVPPTQQERLYSEGAK